MKKLHNALFCIISLGFIFGCNPISIVSYNSSLEKPVGYTEYLNYFLPKAYLKVKVPIEKNSLTEGLIHKIKDDDVRAKIEQEFSLRLGWNPAKKPDKKFDLGKNIQFIPLTVPDSKKHYTIAYKNAKVFAQTLNVNLNKDGIISSGENAQENKTFEYVSKGLELGTSLASSFLLLGPDKGKESLFGAIEDSESFRRIEILTKELIGDDNKMGLINARSNLLTQNASGVSKEAIEYRVNALDKRIEEIKLTIFGWESKTIYWASFWYEPNEDNETVTILELDHNNGVSIPNTEINPLLYINEGTLSNKHKLAISATENSPKIHDNAKFDKAEAEPSKIGYLRYNIPAKFTLQLLWDDKPLKSFKDSEDKKGVDQYTMFFPQFGDVGVLPGDFKEASIVYYEDIGAIKEVKFSRSANLDSNTVQTVYAAADSIASLRNAIKEFNAAKKVQEESTEEVTEEAEETIIKLFIIDESASETEGEGGK